MENKLSEIPLLNEVCLKCNNSGKYLRSNCKIAATLPNEEPYYPTKDEQYVDCSCQLKHLNKKHIK